MTLLLGILLQGFLLTNGQQDDSHNIVLGQFPDHFAFGVASTAYQIEGAWNQDGKGESIWDALTHTPGHVTDGSNGDVAADGYNKFGQDIQLLLQLGVTHYRFSISWPRVMTNGTISTINQKGLDHYSQLVDQLAAHNITPVVALYAWDLPQAVQVHGGWQNSSIIDYFKDYADLCFKTYGNKVKHWITFIEPFTISWMGHETGVHAPGIKQDNGTYVVAHNLILSHVAAYRLYDTKYRSSQHGEVGISLDSEWYEPKTNHQDDIQSQNRALTFRLGLFAGPLVTGDYPDLIKDVLQAKWLRTPHKLTPLQNFTSDEKKQNKGAFDFLGINHYTTKLVSSQSANINDTRFGFFHDQGVNFETPTSYPR